MRNLILLVSIALLAGCSGGNGLATIVTGNPDATMSAKPAVRGVMTGNSLLRMTNTSLDADYKGLTDVVTYYSSSRNDLSYNGGMAADTASYLALLRLTSAIAIAAVDADANRLLSDPARRIPTDLKSASAVPSTISSAGAKRAIANALIKNFTGLPPKEAEVLSLIDTMTELIPMMPNTVAGKKLLCNMLVTIVLMGNSWHGG